MNQASNAANASSTKTSQLQTRYWGAVKAVTFWNLNRVLALYLLTLMWETEVKFHQINHFRTTFAASVRLFPARSMLCPAEGRVLSRRYRSCQRLGDKGGREGRSREKGGRWHRRKFHLGECCSVCKRPNWSSTQLFSHRWERKVILIYKHRGMDTMKCLFPPPGALVLSIFKH